MKSLLSPLINFLSSISYKAKFLLVGVAAILYTSFLVYQNFQALNDDILFSQKEIYGVELLPATKELLLETQKLRGTTAMYLGGKVELSSNVSSLQDGVKAKLQKVKEKILTTKIEGIDSSLASLESDLNSLISSHSSMSAKEVFEKYTNIVNKELDLIVLIGDNSNLILDPDLDSFYMMDAVINKLPEIFEATGMARGIGASILSKGIINDDQKLKLMELISVSKHSLHSLESGFETAYKANDSIKKKLEDKKSLLSQKASSFSTDILTHVTKAQDISSKQFFDKGTEIIESANTLYTQSLKELTILLEKRVLKQESKERILIIEATAFAIFLLVFFMAFYHSVSGAVNSMVKQLKEIEENKDLSKDIVIDTKDELSEISKAYNSFRVSIQNTMKEAILAVDSSNQEAMQMQHEAKEIDENSKEMSDVISKMAQKGESIKNELVSSKEMAQNSKEQISTAYETLKSATESIQKLALQVDDSSHKEMEMADKINQLSQDASDVKNVLTVINDIAEQTNLLALNAAIEAARAGEHGRGFAVVADEVRQLAEKTQKSLSEINATINVIMQNIVEASSEMNQNAQDIASMTETSEEVLKEVEWVNTIMDEATRQIEESAISIEKNAHGVELMAKDLQDTNIISISNTEKVNSITKSSSALATRVNEIKERVETFAL